MSTDEDKLISLLRRLFASKQIEIKGAMKVSHRFLQEGYAVTRVESFEKFISFGGDGKYYIDCNDINMQFEGEHPFSIVYMFVELQYEEGKWSVKVATGIEDTYDNSIEYLEQRRKKIIHLIKSSLQPIATVIKLYSDDNTESS